jgi:hypothetical protein
MKPRFLFLNTRAAQCSIYKSGVQIYEALRGSEHWELDYVEIPNFDVAALYQGRVVIDDVEQEPYDAYIFNYHDITMRGTENILSEHFHRLDGVKYSIILEMEPGNPYSRLFSDDFDGYLVMDPTYVSNHDRFHAFPRPIPPAQVDPYIDTDVPVIGTFGFATQDKYFDRIVEAAAKELKEARIKINIPKATYADPQDTMYDMIRQRCLAHVRAGIDVEFTREFFTDAELIRWCGRNTLNMFMYDRHMPGLAAVTDQAIASGRPLLVSGNETFRHIHSYCPAYPDHSIAVAIDKHADAVKRMQEDWSWTSCQRRLKEILFED